MGLRADFLACGDGLVEERVENGRRRAGRPGQVVGVLDLAEDLAFPDNHGIETAGNLQQVCHAVPALVGIKIGVPELRARVTADALEQFFQAFFRFDGD